MSTRAAFWLPKKGVNFGEFNVIKTRASCIAGVTYKEIDILRDLDIVGYVMHDGYPENFKGMLANSKNRFLNELEIFSKEKDVVLLKSIGSKSNFLKNFDIDYMNYHYIYSPYDREIFVLWYGTEKIPYSLNRLLNDRSKRAADIELAKLKNMEDRNDYIELNRPTISETDYINISFSKLEF